MGPIAYSMNEKGMFVGIVNCQPCKVRLGHFLLPAKATWVKPPEAIDGKQRFFDGVKWRYENIPVVPEVVDKVPLVRGEEVRENADLLRITIDNMRGELEQRVLKAAGKRIEQITLVLAGMEKEFSRNDEWKNSFGEKLGNLTSAVDSLRVEFASLEQRAMNYHDVIQALSDRLQKAEDANAALVASLGDLHSLVSKVVNDSAMPPAPNIPPAPVDVEKLSKPIQASVKKSWNPFAKA